MNFDQLASFVVFAEHRNFSAAARELGISQPSLHVQIRKLGEAVGVPLYARRGRALEITDAGRELAAHGRDVANATGELLAKLRGTHTNSKVVLAAGRAMFLYLLGPIIRRFPKKRYPLELRPLDAPSAIEAVVLARADLALVPRPAESLVAELDIEPILSVGQKLVVPKGHRFAGRRRVRLRDLDNEPLIVAPAGRPHRQMLETALAAAGARLHVAASADGWALMLSLVAANLSAAIVNDYCGVPRGATEVAISGLPSFELCLIRRHSGFESDGSKALGRLIRQHL